METFAGECKMGFARKLASPKNKTREKAISLLLLWLTSQKQIEEDELKKIWKGLFYCVWHSDKAPVQADLIERLASICEKLDRASSLQFFKVFLITMRREWAGIDRLRLDKFYLLLRKCLVHMLVALERSGWDVDVLEGFMDLLVKNAFLAKDQYTAMGVNLHYADIYLSELKNFLPLRVDTFKLLLEPFLFVCANASDRCLLQRIRTNIFDHLVSIGHTVIGAKQEGNSLDPSTESLGFLIFNAPLSSEAFKLASLPSTSQTNRKLLYELHAEFEMLEKLLHTSGVTLSLPESGKKRKKDFGQANSCGKLTKREIQQGKVTKVSSRKTVCDSAVGNEATGVLDKVKRKSKKSEVLKERNLSAVSTAREPVDSSSNKRKVAKCEKDHVLLNKGERSLGSKKSKQKSTGKVENAASVDGAASNSCDLAKDLRLGLESLLGMKDSVVSNLERQFDLLAGESSMDSEACLTPDVSTLEATFLCDTAGKKRKRKQPTSAPQGDVALLLGSENSNDSVPMTSKKLGHNSSGKVKRVRFALKKNLVWTPSTPLPAESVRVPPAATPRGSALKKGVLPGPISSTPVNATKHRKRTPLRLPSHNKTSKNRKSALKRVRLLAKQRRSV